MKTTLLLPALLGVAVLSSGCVVVPRSGYATSYGYSNYGYGYTYGPTYRVRSPTVYVNRPGVYVSRPGARVVGPGWNRGNRNAPPPNIHGARPVGRGGRGRR